MSYPIKTKRADEQKSRVDKMLGDNGYKRGGAIRGDASINITINAGKKDQTAEDGASPLAKAAGLAAAAKAAAPPAPPMGGPPPNAGPGGPPLSIGGGGPVGMKRGGGVRQPDAGAGSGLGRLEKAADVKKSR